MTRKEQLQQEIRELTARIAELEEASVTEHRHYADALREAEQTLRTLLKTSPVVLFATDRNGVFTLSEGQGITALGRRPGAAVGHTPEEIYGDVPEIVANVRRALSGEEFEAVVAVRGLWFQTHYGPLRAQNGELCGMIGVAVDITESRRAQEKHALVAEISHVLAGSLDVGATLPLVTRLLVPRLSDWCFTCVIEDQTVRQVAAWHRDPEKMALLDELQRRFPAPPALWTVVRTGQPQLIAECNDEMLRGAAVSEEHFELVRRIGYRSGLIVPMICRERTVGVIVMQMGESGRRYGPDDVTLMEEVASRAALAVDNARLYREAQEAIRAREEFLSVASHEIRTPLSTLHLQVQVLMRSLQQPDPEKLRPMLEGCDRQIKRLAGLLDNLLDLSRLSAERLHLHYEEVDLAQVVRDAASRFSEELARAGCRATLQIDGPVPGTWDRMRLDQVVTNLISNAIKYGPGGPVTVRVAAEADDAALLSVSDQGVGIPPEFREAIFQPYERTKSAMGQRGLGLGLYIVRKIVDAMGGEIQVHSVHSQPCSGSTFVVKLPRKRALLPRDSR